MGNVSHRGARGFSYVINCDVLCRAGYAFVMKCAGSRDERVTPLTKFVHRSDRLSNAVRRFGGLERDCARGTREMLCGLIGVFDFFFFSGWSSIFVLG